MEITLYLATTPNGFLARTDGTTGWSQLEWQAFTRECGEIGNLIIGRCTFDVMREENEFAQLPNLQVVVLSHRQTTLEGDFIEATSPEDAVKILKRKGFTRALVGGGALTARAFLKSKLISHLVLDIEPILFANGVQSFAGFEQELKLDLVTTNNRSDGGIQVRYRVSYEP